MKERKIKGKKENRKDHVKDKAQTGLITGKAHAKRSALASIRHGRTETPERINKTKKTKGK